MKNNQNVFVSFTAPVICYQLSVTKYCTFHYFSIISTLVQICTAIPQVQALNRCNLLKTKFYVHYHAKANTILFTKFTKTTEFWMYTILNYDFQLVDEFESQFIVERLSGLEVWFSLWVREAPGSNPGWAPFPLYRRVHIQKQN